LQGRMNNLSKKNCGIQVCKDVCFSFIYYKFSIKTIAHRSDTFSFNHHTAAVQHWVSHISCCLWLGLEVISTATMIKPIFQLPIVVVLVFLGDIFAWK
jgi:hypothetical protein